MTPDLQTFHEGEVVAEERTKALKVNVCHVVLFKFNCTLHNEINF